MKITILLKIQIYKSARESPPENVTPRLGEAAGPDLNGITAPICGLNLSPSVGTLELQPGWSRQVHSHNPLPCELSRYLGLNLILG